MQITRIVGHVLAAGSLALLLPGVASAAGEGECAGGLCGTPDESGGGGGGCGGGGSILIANTDLGDTYQYADDYDEDGLEDDFDNCPFSFNKDQLDGDRDGYGDQCDLCAGTFDPEQIDLDGDGLGNACDDDADGDGRPNLEDNCPLLANPSQRNTDNDPMGDACDDDDDGDGFLDVEDNCPLIATATNTLDGIENRAGCDLDADGDGIKDAFDNCPEIANPGQLNTDSGIDALGDACDGDLDGDGIPNALDNCSDHANAGQIDADRDGMGDLCDMRFCYVVDASSPESCLDPNSPFSVHAGETMTIRTGETVRLRIFANRENAAMRYSWTVDEAPEDSSAAPAHSRGAVTLSTPYEYHYLKDSVATFTPDFAGSYVLTLESTLAFPEGEERSTARSQVTIIAEGGPVTEAGGCDTSAGMGSVLGLGLLAGLVIRRRR